MTAENRRTLGTINGNAETIRALKVITNKDDFFAKLARMNKDMNKSKVRVSLTSEGNAMINNQHKVSLSKLYGMGKGGRNKLFSKLGPADTSTKNVPTRLYVSTYGCTSSTFTIESAKIRLTAEGVIKISEFVIKLCKADQEFVAEILSQLSAEIHDAFLLVCSEVSSLIPGDSHFNAHLVYFIFDHIKSKVRECDLENDCTAVIILKTWLKNGRVDKDIIMMLIDRFKEGLPEEVTIGAFHSDPLNYDYIYEFRKRYKTFMTLRAGEEIAIRHHKVIVKNTTVEKLTEWFEVYSQDYCDLLLKFTFKIISLLTAREIYTLILINPDEDIILRVVHYLFHEVVINNLLAEFEENGTMPNEVVANMKEDLLHWRSLQNINVRKHKDCESCRGIYYE